MSYSPQVQLVKEWVHGFETRDLDLLEQSLHKDFRHITIPQTTGEQVERNKDEYVEHLRQIVPQWTESKLTIGNISEGRGKVVCHFINRTKTAAGPNPPYGAFIATVVVADSDGTLKIEFIEEFVSPVE